MAFFKDLTPYGYILSKYTEQPDALNVGWLSKDEPFYLGDASPEFVAALTRLVAVPVNLCRGWHTCEFCGQSRGNGEIRVSRKGTTYAAPIMVLHYVTQHRYLPPSDFIMAVLESAQADPAVDPHVGDARV